MRLGFGRARCTSASIRCALLALAAALILVPAAVAKQPGGPPGQSGGGPPGQSGASAGGSNVPPGQAKKQADQSQSVGGDAAGGSSPAKGAKTTGSKTTGSKTTTGTKTSPGQQKKASGGTDAPGKSKSNGKAPTKKVTGTGGTDTPVIRDTGGTSSTRARGSSRRAITGARLGGGGGSGANRVAGQVAQGGDSSPAARGSTPGTTAAAADTPSGGSRPSAANKKQARSGGDGGGRDEEFSPRAVPRTIEKIVENVPPALWIALAALAGFLVLALIGSTLTTARARRLARQRNELLGEVGLLQAALLPAVPSELGGARVSVAYRPAEGPAAGGDFYDVFELPGGQLGLIVGDVAGHGRRALAQTALVRFTLRAYLEAGMQPRSALALAGEALEDKIGVDFVTVLAGIYDPESGLFTYARAGHPPPVVGGPAPAPVVAGSAPPIGTGMRTGMRQTSMTLPPDASILLFTDGVVDAKVGDEEFGDERLAELVRSLDENATAESLLDDVAARTVPRDDMAAILIRTPAGHRATMDVTQELVVDKNDLESGIPGRFLKACGVPNQEVPALLQTVLPVVAEHGASVMRLSIVDGERRFQALPPDAPRMDPNIDGPISAARQELRELHPPA